MNFTPFSGQFQSAAAAAMPTIHQFAAKFGYEGGGTGGQEARYGGVQLVDGVRFRPDGLVVVSAAQPAVALAPIAPIHTVNAGVKYQTISASSSVNVGNIAYGGQTSYVQESVHLKEREKREYREDHHHDIMASMMHQHQMTQTAPIQQGTQQLLVVLHEPKEAAALARVIKQEGRPDRATNAVPAEFISIGDVSDSSTWQTLGGGVADYLSTLPLPLHHLLKYSTPSNVVEKREEPAIVAAVSSNALPPMNSLPIQPNSAAHSVLVQTTTIVNQNVSSSPPLHNAITYPNNSNSNNNNSHNINNTSHNNSNSSNNSHIVSSNSHIVSNNSHIVSNNSHIVSNNSHIVSNNSHIVSNTSHNINNNSNIVNNNSNIINNNSNVNNNNSSVITNNKRRKKKKANKEKLQRPKPGEIRLTTALDGSTLYCCPECHMAYPERGLLEQHLLGHTMERRYICDICNAALKRKDHLTRHKQSHNPERPHVCSVCLKAFKRKEQLTLHFVIHSGEKRHVCNECGKGFYRKDHLRKHSRSHIARRVKAELSQHQTPAPLPSRHSPDVS